MMDENEVVARVVGTEREYVRVWLPRDVFERLRLVCLSQHKRAGQVIAELLLGAEPRCHGGDA